MSVRDLMARLDHLDVVVRLDGDRLKVSAPEGALTPELRDEMQRRKPEIVSFLEVAARATAYPPSIVPLRPEGRGLPVFAVPGHNGDVFCFVRLVAELGEGHPFFALQPPGLDGRRPPARTVPELAATFAADLVSFRPSGPFVIAGYCLGGASAFETARQLRERGREVAMLALFGSACPTSLKPLHVARTRVKYFAERLAHHTKTIVTLPPGERLGYLRGRAEAVGVAPVSATPAAVDEAERSRIVLEDMTVSAARAYDPGPYDGRLTHYLPTAEWRDSADLPGDWARFAAGGVEERVGPDGCDGDRMLRDHARAFARLFAADLGRLPREE